MALTPEELRIRISAQNDASKHISQVRKDLAWLGTGATQTKKAVMGTTVAMDGFGRKAGMAGIQIQQLVGQVQGGTSAFVALSQQAADLGFVLGFPLLGAVVGIASAFAGPLIAAIMGVKEETESLTKEVDELAGSYETLTDAQRAYYDMVSGRQIKDMTLEIMKLKNEADSLTGIMQMPSESGQGLAADAYKKRLKILSQISELEEKIAYLKNPIAKKQAEERVKTAKEAADEQMRLEEDVMAEFTQRLADEDAAFFKSRDHQLAIQEQMDKAYLLSQQEKQKAYDDLMKQSMEHLKPIEDGLMSLITGSKSVTASFKDMAASIINDLIRIQIQQSITKPLANMMAGAGGIGGIASSIFGGSPAKALGGSVKAGQAYTVGEHGRETFIPSTDGQIVPNGGGEGVIINQTINVTTGVQQTVRAEIANLLPQISNAAKSAVADARQRGGGFSKAMGA
jgi:uncharacterized small protein (DUF1192 family)